MGKTGQGIYEIKSYSKGIMKIIQKSMRYISFVRDFIVFKQQDTRFSVRWKERYACLNDNTDTTGFNQHHTYNVAWAARILSKIKPKACVDISSSVIFNAIASAFVPISFYDYRPANIQLDNLTCGAADMLQLPFETGSVHTMTCLHVLEHIGLGRYGDPLDAEGDLKAIVELKRVIAPAGNLVLTVPIGRPKVIFNADRVYSYAQIMSYFSGFRVQECALIPDQGGLLSHASESMCNDQVYGCGCFWLVKDEQDIIRVDKE
ncbi:MAG: DUF268 domain-containing protein [Elusimicrobia bacterium]|nr:DUF268 domain-containing protein [Elusimicrobiota bacterium]